MKMEEDGGDTYEGVQEDMIEECAAENEEDLSAYSHDNDSFLIELVERYPFIYDNRNPEFKDLGKKEQAWKEIAATMVWPVPECQNRWLRLREKFARETRAMDLELNGGTPNKRRSFALYDKMLFLKNHVKRRRTYPKMVSESGTPVNTKKSNAMQVHVPAMYTGNIGHRPAISSVGANPSPSMTVSSKSATNTNHPAVVQIHQPALVQIIKPVRVSTTEETTPRAGGRPSDVTSTRVGGLVITQSTSDFDPHEDKFANHLNGESQQKANTADVLFGQFVTAELLKLPEPQRKLMKQKILQILYE